MLASHKRLIWGLGFPIVLSIMDFASYYGGKVYNPSNPSDFTALLLWVVPLFIFGDDKIRK